MCLYVTGFIPAGGELPAIEQKLPLPLRHRLGVAFATIENPSIVSTRPSGDRFVRFTGQRHCDCDVALGCKIPAYDISWRYFYSRTKGEYDLRQRAEESHRRSLKDANRWLSLFGYLLGHRALEHFGLLLHWGHDLEKFTYDRVEMIELGEATPETLMLLDQEVVYEFVR